MPVGSIDDIAMQGEVLAMTRSAIGVLHGPICASIDSTEPAEDSIIWCGREFTSRPRRPGHVERIGHHKLTPMEVGTQHKWNALHPFDHCPRFRSHLDKGKRVCSAHRDKGALGGLTPLPQNTHSGIGQCIVGWQWQVMVGDSVGYQSIILCIPQLCVEVSKIVVKVNTLVGPAALCPAHQFGALPRKGLVQVKRALSTIQERQEGHHARWPTLW